MNILLCDDQQAESAKLADLLRDTGVEVNTVVFHNGEEALAYVREGAAVDVCFLDIVMPGMNGVALAEKLRADGFTGEIVFLTFSNEYAAESYQVDAFTYLLKPPNLDRVRDLLQKLENARINRDTAGIFIKTKKITRFLLFREINYVEVMQHKVYFKLVDGDELEMNAAFGEIAPQLLTDRRFAQCHGSILVNMNAISSITAKDIDLRDGTKLPVSKRYSGIKKQYVQWLFDEDEKVPEHP